MALLVRPLPSKVTGNLSQLRRRQRLTGALLRAMRGGEAVQVDMERRLTQLQAGLPFLLDQLNLGDHLTNIK